MRERILQLLFLGCLITTSAGLQAQDFAGHQWYFGSGTRAIRFSRSDNSASLVTQTPLNTGGSAVVSDPINGNLLFYTDGANVYDAFGQAMPNGTGLNANTSENQPVVVARVPGQTNQYYIFTRSAAGAVFQTIVDMSQSGNAIFPAPPTGDVTTKSTPIAGLTGRSQGMATIRHSNGTDFWLITHEAGSSNYTATLFSNTLPPSVVTSSGGLIEQVNSFSYHAASGRIAVAPAEANRNVELLTFDNTSGALTSSTSVNNTATASATGIFDTEWSNSGDYLYVSRDNDVLQFDLINTTISPASVLPQPNTLAVSYGLQMAPDSAIYHLYQATAGGPFLLGKLTDSDTVAAVTTYAAQAFAGNINFNGRQFPAFASNTAPTITLSFVADGLCTNAPTTFYPTVSPGADSLRWDFGDGNTSSEWSPIHTYQSGVTSPTTVTLTAFLNGQSQTTTQNLNLVTFDTQITLVQDTTACSCELPYSKKTSPPTQNTAFCNGGPFRVTAQVAGSGSPQLQWYGPAGLIAGANSATLAPDSAGYYYLVATVGSCSVSAGVNINEYEVQDQRANIWYFGNNAGIDFNPLPDNPPVAISNPVMNAPEGTATISDRNGQVIFFTDGDKVWNRANTEVASGIGGDPGSTQSAIIIPVPGDETLYYIFTTQEIQGTNTYRLSYSLFDLRMNNGTGGLQQTNVQLFAPSTERITGNANWLIAHEYGNNSFRAYRITAQGIANPVISSVGSDHITSVAENGQGYMKLSTQNRIAVALSTPGTANVVEIFDFVDSSGVVTNVRTADLQSPTGQVYGVEFSPGGNKLFATLHTGATSQFVEFNVDSLGRPRQRFPATAEGQKLGAIQLGPDGQLYVAVDNQGALATIQTPDDTTRVSPITLNGFPLVSGTTSRLGLPNFMQSISTPVQGPGIAVAGFCIGDSTSFTGSGTDPIDVFAWRVLNSGGAVVTQSNQQNFSFVFTIPGDYDVSLQITNRCGLDTTLTQRIRINGVPPNPSTAVALCTGPQVLDANPTNATGLTYAWGTGATTQTITVSTAGNYTVTVTNAAGCTTDGTIIASDNRPVVDLGPDLTVCQNTTITALDARNPNNMTYAWTLNGAPTAPGNQRTQSVSTATPGVFTYAVTVTDQLTTCFAQDQIVFTVNQSPDFTFTSIINPSTCGATDGTILLSVTAPTNTLFTATISGPTSASQSDLAPNAPFGITNTLAAGAYGVTVFDQITGCATTRVATLSDASYTVSATQVGTCDPNLALQVTTAAALPFTYRVINSATNAVVIPSTASSSSPFTTPALPGNNSYVVEVRSGGCLASSTATAVTPAPALTATIDESTLCAAQSVSAGPAVSGSSFDWSASQTGSISGATTNATVQLNPGTWNLSVTVTNSGLGCPGTATATVTVDTPVTPTLTQSTACGDPVTLTVTPSGTFLYRWFVNGTLNTGLGGTQALATAAEDGSTYRVTLYNPANGCEYNTADLTVAVKGPLTVSLTSTPPCANTPFTLTATPNRSGNFSWLFNGNTISGQGQATLTDTRAGTYTVKLNDGNCEVTSDMAVLLAPNTPPELGNLARICPEEENPDVNTRQVVLDAGAGYTSYNWFTVAANGSLIPLNVTTQQYTATEEGTYRVSVVNTFGCISDDDIDVYVDCDPVVTGPNAFRPGSTVAVGGEAINATFRLFTFFIDENDFHVYIFNRWGEMVFQSNDRYFKWNGGLQNNGGQPLPPGTYSYVVKYRSSYRPEDGVKEKRGGVVLMR